MKTNLKLFLMFNAIMIGLLLAPLHVAFAQSRSPVTEKSLAAATSRDHSFIVRQHLANKKEEPQLNWPPFPRVWMERTSSRTESSSTSIGFNLGVGSGPNVGPFKLPGFSTQNKNSFDYRYNITTSLILISSTGTQSLDPTTARVHEDFDQAAQDELFLTSKPGTSLVYPLIADNKPMVGLCYFEMTLSQDDTHSKGVEMFGSSSSSTTGTNESGKVSRFSNFFQIQPDVAVESYHYDICAKLFKKQVEESVLKTFSLLVYQMKNNYCTPPPANDIDPAGDLSCMNWYSKFHKTTRHGTTPRCEQQQNGGYRCVLRTKAGNQCRLYKDKNNARSENFDFKRFNTPLTTSYVGIGCDKAMKQTCQMKSEPTLLLGVPLIQGTARCQ